MKYLQIFIIFIFLVGCESASNVTRNTPDVLRKSPDVNPRVEFKYNREKSILHSEGLVKPIVLITPKLSETSREGWVHLKFEITEDGSVKDVKAIDASPKGLGLEKNAIRALNKWKYPRKFSKKTEILFQYK